MASRDLTWLLWIGGLMLILRDSVDWGGGWVVPVPDADVAGHRYPAVVSQEFRRGGPKPHLGLDVVHQPTLPRTPIVAAKDGRIWSVSRTARGWGVVVDHGRPFATFYQHLVSVSAGLVKGTAVKAGQQLGVMGADPTDPEHIVHLHFAVWYKGFGDAASVDPGNAITSWRRVTWTS